MLPSVSYGTRSLPSKLWNCLEQNGTQPDQIEKFPCPGPLKGFLEDPDPSKKGLLMYVIKNKKKDSGTGTPRRTDFVRPSLSLLFSFITYVCKQGCGSGSVSGLDPDSIRSVDPDPDPGRQKWPTKVENFCLKLCREGFIFLPCNN